MIARCLLPALIAASLASSLAWADTIKLKSGEVIRGTITEEDSNSLTIVYEAAKGIRDEKKIPRPDIEQAVKDDPGDRAWAEISAGLPTPDMMTTSQYDGLISKVEGFIKTHPTSMKVGEARRLLLAAGQERDRVEAGDLKIDSHWITAAQYQKEKYWVDGRIALRQFSELVKSGRSVEALRHFEKMEASYMGTTIYVKAVEKAKIALLRYSGAISESMLIQPQLEQKRKDGLASLSFSEKKATEEAQVAEAAAFKIRSEEEKKTGTKWFTLNPYNLADLEAAKKTVDMELARLTALNLQDAEQQEAALRQIDQAINEGRFNDAEKSIQQASRILSNNPYLVSLQERIKSEATRLEAEKNAAEAARVEAQRRAAESMPPPPTLPKEKEKDPLEDAVNPIAKAVLESDLGKRVNHEVPAPPPPEQSAPPTPTPALTPESTATSTEATTPAPNSPSTTPATQKNSGSGMTTILYVVAGLLLFLLLALLLAPIFKRKVAREEVQEQDQVLEEDYSQEEDEVVEEDDGQEEVQAEESKPEQR